MTWGKKMMLERETENAYQSANWENLHFTETFPCICEAECGISLEWLRLLPWTRATLPQGSIGMGN